MSSDLQAPLLNDVDREVRTEDYSNEEDVAEIQADEALLGEGRDLPSPARAYFIRSLALLCACSLSVGSH